MSWKITQHQIWRMKILNKLKGKRKCGEPQFGILRGRSKGAAQPASHIVRWLQKNRVPKSGKAGSSQCVYRRKLGLHIGEIQSMLDGSILMEGALQFLAAVARRAIRIGRRVENRVTVRAEVAGNLGNRKRFVICWLIFFKEEEERKKERRGKR